MAALSMLVLALTAGVAFAANYAGKDRPDARAGSGVKPSPQQLSLVHIHLYGT